MKVYLADLFHTFEDIANPDSTPYTVPLGIGYLAATIKKKIPDVEVRLFRDPNLLIPAVRTAVPDVMGFTFTSWNTDLTQRAARMIKAIAPKAYFVAGGPAVDDTDEQIIEFIQRFSDIDFVIPGEGEPGIVALLTAINNGHLRQQPIPGVAYLDSNGQQVRGTFMRPIVSTANKNEASGRGTEVPSPYLDGTLDAFLDAGLVPIIQTMRGCPYHCRFCVSGTTIWDKLRGFDPVRVKAEIDYALDRNKSKDLILTDENWGILGARDVDIARHIMDRHQANSSPNRLYYYTAKIVNDSSREIIEMVSPIAWNEGFNMSFQTLNPESRNAMKRTNITLEKLAENLQWARDRNITTSSEMIYGFPYETLESFFDGIELLFKAGMNKVLIYPLQLFSGIDLALKEMREKYNLSTSFRLYLGAYGTYCDGDLISAEAEEVIVSSKWSTLDDYFRVRRYSFFLMALFSREYLLEFANLCYKANVMAATIVRHLAIADYSDYPTLDRIMKDYNSDAADELKNSREEVYQSVYNRLKAGEKIGGVKVIHVYIAKIFSSPQATHELFEVIFNYYEKLLMKHPDREVLLTYLKEILPIRVVMFDSQVHRKLEFFTRFAYQKWLDRTFDTLSDLLLPEPKKQHASAQDVLMKNLEGFDPTNKASLQEILDKTPCKNLLRTVS